MPQITLQRDKVEQLVNFCKANKLTEFYLAKDHGAYIGASGQEDIKNCIFYFKGCNPDKNPDTFWDTQQKLFGGDDFGEFYPITLLTDPLFDTRVTKLTFKVTPKSFRVVAHCC